MPKKLRAATAAEAVKGFEAVEAFRATEPLAVASLQGFRGPEAWGSIAYVSMCERTGAASRLHITGSSASLESNGAIEILGGGYGPWPPHRGIGAEFEVPSWATYACTVRLSRPPNFTGLYEFAIDQTVLGILGIQGSPASPVNYTFVVRLGPGTHMFWVREFSVTFWFYSLTVLVIPELAPA
jgi:hypothetical protein